MVGGRRPKAKPPAWLLCMALLTHMVVSACFAGCSAAGPAMVTMVSSTKDTSDRLTPKPPVPFQPATKEGYTVTVDTSRTYQKLHGFGGAFTEAAAFVVSQMKPELQDQILEAYYGPSGIGYSTGRVPINSCDFSQQSHAYDNSTGDFDLVNFTITGPDTDLKIPLILRAMNKTVRPLRLFASPWSPPAWMKRNGAMDRTSKPCLLADPRVHAAWANYFVRFFDAYQAAGVSFWGYTVQNEPYTDSAWEACSYTAEEQRDFIKHFLGPAMNASHPELAMMIYDDQKLQIVPFVTTVLSDQDAARYVSGIGVHWYMGPWFNHLAELAEKFPDVFILGTEACEGYLPWAKGPRIGDWHRGEAYGNDILGDLEHSAVGWTDWNIVLDEQGGPNHVGNFCDAPIIADTKTQVLHFQPTFYYLGHFSKFLPPGSVRVHSQAFTRGLEAPIQTTAWLTSGRNGTHSVVVIVMNRSDHAETIQLIDAATPGLAATVHVPAHSIHTLSYVGGATA